MIASAKNCPAPLISTALPIPNTEAITTSICQSIVLKAKDLLKHRVRNKKGMAARHRTRRRLGLKAAMVTIARRVREEIKNFLSDKNSKPKLKENDILKLHEFFVNDVTKIQDLLQQKLHWKHFPNTF